MSQFCKLQSLSPVVVEGLQEFANHLIILMNFAVLGNLTTTA